MDEIKRKFKFDSILRKVRMEQKKFREKHKIKGHSEVFSKIAFLGILVTKTYRLVSVLPFFLFFFIFFVEKMLFISDFKYPNGDIFQTVANQLFKQANPAYTSYYQ